MPQYLQIVGRKKSGKTRLIENLTRELVKRGYRIATIKHTSHDHDFDRPGTDSWRHRKAGSESTIILSPHNWICHSSLPGENTMRTLEETLFRDKDLVICEGHRERETPMIECVARGQEPIFKDRSNMIALISEDRSATGIPNFDPANITEVALWIIKEFGLKPSAC